jgi:hypothetical protein
METPLAQVSTAPLFNIDGLCSDLRLAANYAARVGLIKDDSDLYKALRDAEAALSDERTPDGAYLALALSRVCDAIAPVTLADLKSGIFYPQDPEAIRKLGRYKGVLGPLAIATMVLIGSFTVVLQEEKSLLLAIDQLPAIDMTQQLTGLRKFAQSNQHRQEDPMYRDEFMRRMAEYKRIVNGLDLHGKRLQLASIRPMLFPFSVPEFSAFDAQASSTVATSTTTLPRAADDGELCQATADGGVEMPKGNEHVPTWIRREISEAVADFCFRIKVLSADGSVPAWHATKPRHEELPAVRRNVEIGVSWVLPFLFGLLGTLIFLLRTTGDQRRRPMVPTDVLVRTALGSLGGIVMGWFFASSSPALSGSLGTVSLPLAIAFLTGYGIDILFRLLDRLSRMLDSPPAESKARTPVQPRANAAHAQGA